MLVIYTITNLINHKVYVGSTTNTSSRFSKHRSMLRKGTHRNRLLQEDYNTHGISNLLFSVAESHVPVERRYAREQYWMDYYKRRADLYNILPIAGSAKGRKYTQETLQKMSEAAKGRTITDRQRSLLRERNLGKKASIQTRQKMSDSQRMLDRTGENGSGSKLTRVQAVEIISKLLLGHKQSELSEEYGISRGAIGHLWHGRTWKELQSMKHKEQEATV